MKKAFSVDQVAGLNIGVVGAGSWGTALANLLANKGYRIDLWVYEPEVREAIEKRRENPVFLPGIRLSENLFPSCDLKTVLQGKDLVLVVVPSHVMRATAKRMTDGIAPDTIVVSASKGIENDTLMTMTQVLAETLRLPDERLAVLSGPSFAREVALNVPTLVTVASKHIQTATIVQHVFATPYFRVYTHTDVIGVELGGSVKNVIAIAAGVIDGMALGLDTRAALITRGLAEIRRLGLKMGATPHTFAGLAGVGDLILTCTGELSRNHTVGKKLGQGMKLAEILAEMKMVAEGIKTSRSVVALARKMDVEMPISTEVYNILYENASPKDALFRLMTRDLKPEYDEA
ncbi:MAG: NAD(P)H-dependent glycerol-3-phosphate dehydrogenase [Thermodesulfobacteriota bacterium]